jgi:hypothetical protein
LTLIPPMGQWACCLPVYFERRPITPLLIDVTIQPFQCWKDQTKIIDAPLTLTLEKYQQSFGGQWFCLNVIPSLLTANPQLLGRIICMQKHWGIPVSEPPLFTSSARWMT